MPFHDIFSRKISESKKPEQDLEITVDIREKNSLVVSELFNLGFKIKFKTLEVGDYIVKNTIIERKTVSDFLSSMLNRRLINQLQDLQNVKSKLLIIEGIDEQELYHKESGINENSIRGFLLSIVLSYQIPIIYTKDYEDTSQFLAVLGKKQKSEKEIGLNLRRKSLNRKEQMQYIIEGFPGIGPKTAKKLLKEFKTIKGIINAPFEEIQRLIGKKADIFRLLEENF